MTQYTCDDFNRKTGEQWYASTSACSATDALSFGYDLAGNMYQASETNAQNSADNSAYWYQYNMPGNVTEIQAEVPNLPLGGRVYLYQTFNANNDLTSLSAIALDTFDFLNNYTYDNLGEIAQITQSAQQGGNAVAPKCVDFSYDADGRMSTISRYDSLEIRRRRPRARTPTTAIRR